MKTEIVRLSSGFYAVLVEGAFLYAAIPSEDLARKIAASVAGGGPLIFPEYI